MREFIEWPTMRFENTSLTAHKYNLPSLVGCSVMSVSHNSFGPVAVKSLSTRSPCTGGPGNRVRPRRFA